MPKYIKPFRRFCKQIWIYASSAPKWREIQRLSVAEPEWSGNRAEKNGKTMLVVERDLPSPDRDAGSRTIFEFLKCLVGNGWHVSFWPWYGYDVPEYSARLRALGVEVVCGFFRPGLKTWLRRQQRQIDVFLIGRPEVADAYLDDIKATSTAPTVYYGHDLHYARLKMQAEIRQDKNLFAESERMRALEKSIWARSSVSLYPSEDEAVEARSISPNAILRSVTPFCFDAFAARTRATKGSDVLFVAGFRHLPNIDAAQWLVNDVLPKIRARNPEVRLRIAGSSPPQAVKDLASDGVDVLGWVSEQALAALYQNCRACVVPLRFGAGMKLKVVEALANGIPLVTTKVGAQGLGGVGDIIEICDDSEGFAAAVGRILALKDDEWLAQSARQAAYARSQFSRAAMSESLEKAIVVADCASAHGPR